MAYDSRWEATITTEVDGATTSRTVTDDSPRLMDVDDGASAVELSVEKVNGDPPTLTAQILVEETVVAEGFIRDTYGSVTISRQFY